MSEWCVFCGADIPEGGLVCQDCRPRVANLDEDKRVLIEEIEKDEKAKETLRAAMVNLAEPLSRMLESLAALMRQFGERSPKT
mgnify:CR=1 FL=1